MYTPKKCVDWLLADLEEVERDYVSREDWMGASETWEGKLFLRNYFGLKHQISETLPCGPSVCGLAEQLVDELKKGNARSIRRFKAFGAQTNLPNAR